MTRCSNNYGPYQFPEKLIPLMIIKATLRPLDRDIARTREGLRGTFVLMAVVSGSLLVLSGLFLLARGRRLRDPCGDSGAKSV